MKAFIQDEWKIHCLPVPFETGGWTLRNVMEDPGEMRDLSDQHPEKKAELIAAWRDYAEQNDVFDH